MTRHMSFIVAILCSLALAGNAQAAAGKRVTVTGEVIDSWCYLTEIMYPLGTAHHQCAVWCAAGGIPVGIRGDDEKVYMVLKMESDSANVANPAILKIQTRRVTATGDLYRRDGIDYLLINKVVEDAGIANQTHDEYGIQPFGK
jgi:hypothetical protein